MHSSDELAFMHYLQTGSFPLGFEYKRDGFNPRFDISAIPEVYIWRIAGDSRVSPEHAANDGKRFTRDNPPPTGHPGQRYGCRCVAEAVVPDYTFEVGQEFITSISDHKRWNYLDWANHYWLGGGRTVTLEKIGHAQGLIDFYLYKITRNGKNTYERLNEQILKSAQAAGEGTIRYAFNNSYTELSDYHRFFGGGTVSGEFNGNLSKVNGVLEITGVIDFRYSDTFTDIYNLRETVLRENSKPLDVEGVFDANLYEMLVSDVLGTYFDIIGQWRTRFHAQLPDWNAVL